MTALRAVLRAAGYLWIGTVCALSGAVMLGVLLGFVALGYRIVAGP